MKKYAKIVQSDARGQIVIPKEVRQELGIDEGTGFWLYAIQDEGILLKTITYQELSQHKELLDKVKAKASKLKLNQKNIDAATSKYKKTQRGKLKEI